MGSLDFSNVQTSKPLDLENDSESSLFPPLRIFISSTVKDLQRERDAIERAIKELHYKAVRSEKVGSQSATPREICALMAQECDIYLAILGRRYGYILPEGISATEFEFNTAQEAGKPILLYHKSAPDIDPEQQAFLDRLSGFDTGYYIRKFDDNDVPDRLIEWVRADVVQQITHIVRGEVPAVKPPAERRREVGSSGRRTLIASLGRSPGAVTGLVDALIREGTSIDRVRTVSTSEYQVQRAVKVVREELKAQGLTDYEDVCIGSADITRDYDVQEFKGAFAHLLAEAQETGDEVAIGIAGGRTVMGALLALVAQMEAPPHSYFYQLSVPDAIEEDGRIPQFSRLPPDRQREVLRPMAHFMDQCYLVKVPFARFVPEEE
jgi:hypothetical protein